MLRLDKYRSRSSCLLGFSYGGTIAEERMNCREAKMSMPGKAINIKVSCIRIWRAMLFCGECLAGLASS